MSNPTERSNGYSEQNPLNPERSISMKNEIKLLLGIAVPTSAVQLLIYFLFTQAASAVGRQLGTLALASFSLASLTGNLLCLSTIIGSLSASDTLMPRAFGLKQYEEVGRLAIRGYLACSMVLIPVSIPLLFFMEPLYIILGIDPEVANLASQWIRIYLVGIPFVLLYRNVQRFMAAQNLVEPLVVGAFVGTCIVASYAIRIGVKNYGFVGSAYAIVITQIITIATTLWWMQLRPRHNPRTWPSLSSLWKDSVHIDDMKDYLHLSTGGVYSFTEWWFWEANCFIAGRFGVLPFAVHSIAYQILPLCYMLPLGFSMGLSVRMGALFSKSASKVKQLVIIVMIFNLFMAGSISFFIYYYRDLLISFFTQDEDVKKGCQSIWPNITIYVFLLYFYCLNSYITRALGQQWRMAAIVVATLWFGSFPTILFFCVYRGQGLQTLWTILPISYLVLNLNLFVNYIYFTDWNDVGEEVKKRMLTQSSETLSSSNERSEIVDENTRLV